MERLQQLMMRGGAGGAGGGDGPVVDTAEMVYISSLALLKMLKHGRAGVPMEVRSHRSPMLTQLRATVRHPHALSPTIFRAERREQTTLSADALFSRTLI